MNKMTFHECYGELPVKTLRLIKKFNVSPADFDMMTDILGNVAYRSGGTVLWGVIDSHIIDNSTDGYYRPDFY